MKKIKIYQFWYGDENTKEALLEKAYKFNKKSKHFTIDLGPNKQDNKYLMQNFKCYADYIEKKQYALASDIYRFYIMSKNNNAIYMDATIEFDEAKLIKLYKKCFDNKLSCFVFESYKIVWSGFFINIDLNHIFTQCLTLASKRLLSGPLVITQVLRKNKLIKNYRKVNYDRIKQYDISFLSINKPIDTIKINPMASWRSKDAATIWLKKEKNFYKTNIRDTLFLWLPFFVKKMIFRTIK